MKVDKKELNSKDKTYLHNPSLKVVNSLLSLVQEKERTKVLDRFIREKDKKVLVVREITTYLGYKDNSHYIKLFLDKNSRSNDFLTKFFDISLGSQRLLIYIIDHLEFNKDSIVLLSDRVINEIVVSYRSYNRALNELLKKEWIYRSTISKNVFYINLALFCYGNREDILSIYTKTVKEVDLLYE